jgi:hypothetical protein
LLSMIRCLTPLSIGCRYVRCQLHKTGGSMTQSSILLLNEERISYSTVKTAINLNQTNICFLSATWELGCGEKAIGFGG